MTVRATFPASSGRRRKVAVTAALTLSAASMAGVSGTSRADIPLDGLAPVTSPVTTATAPVTAATAAPVASATQPVTQAAAAATAPVTQAAAPVTQAAATTTKPVTQAAATTTQPVTQAAATTTQPVTQAAATATKPVTQAAASATKPAAAAKTVTQAAAAATQVTHAASTAVKPATEAVTSPARQVTRAAASAAGAAKGSVTTRAAAAPRGTKHVQRNASNANPTHAGAARIARRAHAGAVHGRKHVRAATGGRAVVSPRTLTVTRPAQVVRVITLSPVTLAAAAPSSAVAASPAPPVSAPQPNGGSSSTAFGLAALVGAGGVAILRARQIVGAMGIDDAGTLTALGHSVSTFWAGSCLSLGTSGAVPMSASLTAEALSPVSALGSRAEFGVKGVISGAADAVGGRVPVASFARAVADDDRTGLVAALFVASAIVGAALGAIAPRHREA